MPSYQDIETRLRVCEDKLDLIMKAFTITKRYESALMPGQVITETKTLLDIYRETKREGLIIHNVTDDPATVEKIEQGVEKENGDS